MKGNKYLPYVIFGIPAAIAVYMIVKSLTKKKGQDAPTQLPPNTNSSTEPTSGGSGGVKPTVAKYFPLRKGSKGAKVKELQETILQFDKNALPKFGADSDFGTETETALKTIYNKTSIASQEELTAFKQFVAKKTSSAIAAQSAANDLQKRTELAKKLVTLYLSQRGYRFYALSLTIVDIYTLTLDGRESFAYTRQEAKGNTILPTAGTFDNYTFSASVNKDGYIRVVVTDNIKKTKRVFYFSPNTVEVR